MKHVATRSIVAALTLCLTAYGASAGGLGAGGGSAGGGGGHMGGGGGMHMGGGMHVGGMHMGGGNGGVQMGGNNHGGGFAGGANRGGRFVVRGGGYGAGYGGYGYGAYDGYQYGDNGGEDLYSGRSAAESGDTCTTPRVVCQTPEAAYVGDSCSCRTHKGKSFGRVTN